MLTAKEIMTTDVISVPPDMPVEDLAALFCEHKIGGAPVMEDGNLLGVVTESDLIDQNKNLHIPTVINILDAVFVLNPNKVDQEFQKMAGRTVRDIFSRHSVTVGEDTPLNEIATLMAEKHVHTLPVVTDGKLVGIVGKSDLIKSIIMKE
ncbi:CBS domain-containing protein [Desulfobacterota bacterium M19]